MILRSCDAFNKAVNLVVKVYHLTRESIEKDSYYITIVVMLLLLLLLFHCIVWSLLVL